VKVIYSEIIFNILQLKKTCNQHLHTFAWSIWVGWMRIPTAHPVLQLRPKKCLWKVLERKIIF